MHEQEQRRRAAVVAALPSERRNRWLVDNASDRSDPRLSTSDPPTGAAVDTRHLAIPRGADDVPSGARVPGSALTLGMFSPDSTGGLQSSSRARGPSSATVESDAVRDTENNRGSSAKQVKDAHREGTGSSSLTILRREELIPDSNNAKPR